MPSSVPPTQHFPGAQQKYDIPLIAGDNVFLGDVIGRYLSAIHAANRSLMYPSTDSNDPAPISGGLFRMKKGQPFTATYRYHETLIVLEGSFIVSDDSGNQSTAAAGDIYWIPKGATVTIGTDDYGLAFYTAQRMKRT
ncbi:putative ethanolamine utilization protein (EutQ) [Cladophialophora carrionii]|uniref:Putative ethanolamine utilization protein (EutQ) n=1 Tax=Cladophialophora carrionii TaxID=86049 RepID=A0A1C1CV32_9EURO|nr:putative ethanolamine utilization protein (EutQ) [Cladophialophora carrionii]